MRSNLRLPLMAVAVLLNACSGGNGGDTPPRPAPPPSKVSPPSGLSYSSPQPFVVGQQIAPLTPTLSGTASGYAIAPALPAGLTVDPQSGVISGTPSVVSAETSYTITASNAAGSTRASIIITINDVPPSMEYGRSDFLFTTGVPVSIRPDTSGGTITDWSITPDLPYGLTFSTTSGSITGTPHAEFAPTSYAVRALNSGGVVTRNLSIGVESGVLLDLGHAVSVELLRHAGERVLSLDADRHWVLWNEHTAASVANGASTCNGRCQPRADLAGSRLVIRTSEGLEVRSAETGDLVFNISADISWWRLASDGSYICIGNEHGLTVWSSAGTQLLSHSGDYSQAQAFASPDEIRVGGAAGANVIETIALPSGVSSASAPFQGQFHSWFGDGERFLTHVGNTVWVYSREGMQQDSSTLRSIAGLAGQGEWFWIEPSKGLVEIYAVDPNTTAPAATYPFGGPLSRVVASKTTLGLLPHTANDGRATFITVDLSGQNPSKTEHALPIAEQTSYVALSDGRWLVSSSRGVLVDASDSAEPLYFGFGQARSIVGNAHRIAIATASGRILLFDAQTRMQKGTIDFHASKLALSGNGTILGAAADDEDDGHRPDRSLKIFTLLSKDELLNVPSTWPEHPVIADFSLSGSGQVLGRVLSASFAGSTTYTREVTTTSGTFIWSDSGAGSPIRLSPDGSLIAVSDQSRPIPSRPSPDAVTNIFKNGSLATAAPGWPAGWIDDERVLVNKYVDKSTFILYVGCSIVTSAGAELPCALPEIQEFQVVTADSVYSPQRNSIFSISSGSTLWSSANPTRWAGAVAGSRVVFASGATVRTEPIP